MSDHELLRSRGYALAGINTWLKPNGLAMVDTATALRMVAEDADAEDEEDEPDR